MDRRYAFVQVDVFTDRPLTGNPPAVDRAALDVRALVTAAGEAALGVGGAVAPVLDGRLLLP